VASRGQPPESPEAWNAVAEGWERRASVFREATHELSERLVALLDPSPGETILELAAGIGETGFAAAPRLAPGGRLISSDVAPAMLAAARRRAAALGVEADFRVLDLMAIDLPDGAVGGVLCRFGIMLVEDPAVALAELSRVLRPRGRAAVAVWASPDENDWMTAVGRSAVALGLAERPDPRAPGPFRLADAAELRELLAEAGLAVEALEDVPVVWRAGSLDEWWGTAGDMSPTMRSQFAGLAPEQIDAVRAAAETRLASHVRDDGSVVVPGLARVVLATRP
jgi:ubiquinone/menaquinone biosynthesis C-methylase UbiE